MAFIKKHIIWDWNGTLLNDMTYCVDCMNKVLKKHGIPPINEEIYLKVFTFPIIDYYKAVGFDFSKIDFEIPAMEFIEYYYSDIQNIELHNDSISILKHFKQLGIQQFCLSAMEHNSLIKLLETNELTSYFSNIKGIENHFAKSKISSGEELISNLGLNKHDIIMIGDTIHDLEVADHLNIDCLLVSHGHQSRKRIKKVTNNVVNNLTEVAAKVVKPVD